MRSARSRCPASSDNLTPRSHVPLPAPMKFAERSRSACSSRVCSDPMLFDARPPMTKRGSSAWASCSKGNAALTFVQGVRRRMSLGNGTGAAGLGAGRLFRPVSRSQVVMAEQTYKSRHTTAARCAP